MKTIQTFISIYGIQLVVDYTYIVPELARNYFNGHGTPPEPETVDSIYCVMVGDEDITELVLNTPDLEKKIIQTIYDGRN
jgi:hypothetical protein